MDDALQTEPRGNVGVDRPPRRPRALFFGALAVAWFLPSAVALSFLLPEPRTGPGYFRNFFEMFRALDWFGWLLLAPAFAFAAVAVWYYCAEKPAGPPPGDVGPEA